MRCLKMFLDWHLPVQPHITYSLEKKLVYREKWKVYVQFDSSITYDISCIHKHSA